MDEYLFITLAKLKADRIKLQDAQAQPGNHPENHQVPTQPATTHTRRARWFNADSELAEAGWSD